MRMRIGAALVVVVFMIGALVVSCGEKEGQDTVKINLGEVTRSLFYAPQYVAISEGFFEEEGLEVELTTTFGGDKTMTALLSDGIDIALVGSETSIYVAQQGATDPVINFAQLTQTDGTFLVAREADEAFDWQSLMGTTFLGQRKGGMPQMAGEFTLRKHGIDPQADLELIQNIDFANIPAAFASGTGEYVQLFEPQASIFEQEGRGHVVASFGAESGHLPYTVFMAKSSYLKDNEAAVAAFTRAIHKAQLWVMEQDSGVIADSVLPFFDDTDRELVIMVIDRYKNQDSYASDPIVDEAEWNNLLDVMESAGELQERVAHEELVDNSFAEQAIQEVAGP